MRSETKHSLDGYKRYFWMAFCDEDLASYSLTSRMNKSTQGLIFMLIWSMIILGPMWFCVLVSWLWYNNDTEAMNLAISTFKIIYPIFVFLLLSYRIILRRQVLNRIGKTEHIVALICSAWFCTPCSYGQLGAAEQCNETVLIQIQNSK